MSSFNQIEQEETQESEPLPFGVLNPSGNFRLLLELLGAIFISFDFFTIPVIFAFWDRVEEPWQTRLITLMFWSMESCLGFTTSFFRRGELVTSRKAVAWNYFKTWFIIDVLTVGFEWTEIVTRLLLQAASLRDLPWDVLRFIRIVRLGRLLRIVKLKKLSEALYDRVQNEWQILTIEVVKLLAMISSFSHVLSCGWFGVSLTVAHRIGMHSWIAEADYFDPSTGFVEPYFMALHWAFAQLTPGTNHIGPQNSYEQRYAVLTICLSMVAFSSYISSMTATVTRLRGLSSVNDQRFSKLRKYLRDHHVPNELGVRIKRFVEFAVWQQSLVMKDSDCDLLKMLTRGLSLELHRAKLEPHLLRYPLFQWLNAGTDRIQIMRRICNDAVKLEIYAPLEFVFYEGEQAAGMYMIVRGTFELSIRRGRENRVPSKHARDKDLELGQTATTRKTVLPQGEFHTTLFNVRRLGGARSLAAGERKQRLPRFAEFALFNPWVHKASLLSTGYGEVLKINRIHFCQCLDLSPSIKAELNTMTKRRYAVISEYLEKENIGDYVPVSLSEKVDKALDVEHGYTRPPRATRMNPFRFTFAKAGFGSSRPKP
jgi:hypothetical protein